MQSKAPRAEVVASDTGYRVRDNLTGTVYGPWAEPVLAGRKADELNAEACAQCGHRGDAHLLYTMEGDDEPWSFCSECGGQCEFRTKQPRMDYILKLHADGALTDDEYAILARHYGEAE